MTADLEGLFGALCATPRYQNSSEHNWFPELDEVEKELNARDVCRRCPVKFNCAQAGLTGAESWGIWGGMEEFRVRRALGRDSFGDTRSRARDLRCPYCDSDDLEISKKRFSKGYPVVCNSCSISWSVHRAPDKVRKALEKRDDMARSVG